MSSQGHIPRNLLSINAREQMTLLGILVLALQTVPFDAKAQGDERGGEQIVQKQCVKCHLSGDHGAPKIGDQAAWIPRLKNGLDSVVRAAIRGHGDMPARGGMADLTDPEFRSAVIYMFNRHHQPSTDPARGR